MESSENKLQSGGTIEFYKHKNVLLTGTTGFIGKIMISLD